MPVRLTWCPLTCHAKNAFMPVTFDWHRTMVRWIEAPDWTTLVIKHEGHINSRFMVFKGSMYVEG
jgi:hypothetical protein